MLSSVVSLLLLAVAGISEMEEGNQNEEVDIANHGAAKSATLSVAGQAPIDVKKISQRAGGPHSQVIETRYQELAMDRPQRQPEVNIKKEMTDPHAPLTNRQVMLMIVALSTYTALKNLKKSTHCQKYLEMEEQVRRSGVDSDVRIKPSSCTDLIQMTHQPSSQPSRAPQIAILPWKYTQGACWTTPLKTMPGTLFMRPKCQNSTEMGNQHSSIRDGASPDRRVQYGTSNTSGRSSKGHTTKHSYNDNSGVGSSGDTPKFHAPIQAIFQSAANRSTFVVPPASEKCG